jgi:hypothetical protein
MTRLAGNGALLLVLLISACAGRPDPQPWVSAEGEGEGEGEGDVPLSDVQVAPLECDFDGVPLGSSRSCAIVIDNMGPREVEVVSITITTATEVFSLPSPRGGPVQVGAGWAVRVTAHPHSLGLTESTLVIGFTGALVPTRIVPLTVTGTPGPDCVARLKSVNGAPVAPGVFPTLAPLDDVVLSLDESTCAPDRTIVQYEWQSLSRPAGSTVQLSAPASVDTGFTFDERLGLDVAGTYAVRATVFDSAGRSASCELELEAAPQPGALRVQLFWDSPQGDLDLHLRRDTDALCSAADCYALTCTGGGPDWGSPDASPHLDADGIGFGPETITVDAPADDTYLVAVHGRGLPAAGNATVRAFFDGSLLFEGSAAIEDGQLWQVAAISCVAGSCEGFMDAAVAALSTCAP